jgi:hypothetical protein
MLCAIEAAPRHQAGKSRNADSKDLFCENVIDTRLQVRYLLRKTVSETPSNLAEEHS